MKIFSNLCHPSYVATIVCIVFFQLEHERVWNSQRFTQIQLRVVTQQWQRDHEELLVRALVTLEEARHAHQKEMELQKDRQQQQDICLQLREKVCAWNDFEFFKVQFYDTVQGPPVIFNLCREWIYHFIMLVFRSLSDISSL